MPRGGSAPEIAVRLRHHRTTSRSAGGMWSAGWQIEQHHPPSAPRLSRAQVAYSQFEQKAPSSGLAAGSAQEIGRAIVVQSWSVRSLV